MEATRRGRDARRSAERRRWLGPGKRREKARVFRRRRKPRTPRRAIRRNPKSATQKAPGTHRDKRGKETPKPAAAATSAKPPSAFRDPDSVSVYLEGWAAAARKSKTPPKAAAAPDAPGFKPSNGWRSAPQAERLRRRRRRPRWAAVFQTTLRRQRLRGGRWSGRERRRGRKTLRRRRRRRRRARAERTQGAARG